MKGHRNVMRGVAVVGVLLAGALVGWLVGNRVNAAAAAQPVPYIPAAAIGLHPFTNAADIAGPVIVTGFGGTGSNLVCDREKMISFLVQHPARLRAWATVETIPQTAAAVTKYIRSLHPATLLRPTRVTNHYYFNGVAVPFQAILAAGTAVLVDSTGAIRARCRCGNPLVDPILSSNERCTGCPGGSSLPKSWQLGPIYYAIHPFPPPVQGERAAKPPKSGLSVTVLKILPGAYVLQKVTRGENGKAVTTTMTVPAPPTAKSLTKTIVKTDTATTTATSTVNQTSTVRTPPATVTVDRPLPPQTVTQTVTSPPQTVTVYTKDN